METEVQTQTVLVSKNLFEAHPESYELRVFVLVYGEKPLVYYELLKTGQAIPWTESPEGRGFDFWIVNAPNIADVGVNRAS